MVESFEERSVMPVMRRISWAAIFGGLAIALISELLLNLLGIGLGASTIHPTSSNGASAQSVGIGSAIWFVIATVISLFAGGWVAGRLAGIPRKADGVLHGLIAWSLTSLFTVYLLTTAVGGVISGATGALGTVFTAAGSGIAAVAPVAAKSVNNQIAKSGVSTDDITSKVQQILRETGNPRLSPSSLKAQGQHQANVAGNAARNTAMHPGNAKQNYNEVVYRFLHETGTTSQAADRQSLINVVAAEQHITKAQAAKTVDGWSQQATQAKQEGQKLVAQTQQNVKEAGDATAAAVAKAALFSFALFLLGGIAAALGGLLSIRSIVIEAVPTEKHSFVGSGTITRETTRSRSDL